VRRDIYPRRKKKVAGRAVKLITIVERVRYAETTYVFHAHVAPPPVGVVDAEDKEVIGRRITWI